MKVLLLVVVEQLAGADKLQELLVFQRQVQQVLQFLQRQVRQQGLLSQANM